MLESLATPFIISHRTDIKKADIYWLDLNRPTLVKCGNFFFRIPHDCLARYEVIGIQPSTRN